MIGLEPMQRKNRDCLGARLLQCDNISEILIIDDFLLFQKTMERKAKILLTILGLGAIVAFIETLELADRVFQVASWFPTGPIKDVFLLLTLFIILYAVTTLEKRSKSRRA